MDQVGLMEQVEEMVLLQLMEFKALMVYQEHQAHQVRVGQLL
jgi:hypothetical protein